MEESLLEYSDSRGTALQVDHDSGVIRGVKILGLESRNGRTYAIDALQQARALYEGAKVNVNHPKGAPTGPREYQDRLGLIRNVSVVADSGLFGDLHFNPAHAVAGQLEWDARHAPENVGLSHNVLARTSRVGDRVLVEAITRVLSVDLVADPATTHGLFEELDPAAVTDDADSLQRVTPERVRAARPDLVDALLAEARAECDRLQSELKAAREAGAAAQRRETAARLLRETLGERVAADIDLSGAAEHVAPLLAGCTDERAMRSVLEAHLQTLAPLLQPRLGARRMSPQSREQQTVDPASTPSVADTASFLRAVRG